MDSAHTGPLSQVHEPDPAIAPHELWERLCRTELPRLWLPKQQDLRRLDALPLLASGKLDLRRLKQMASDAGA